MTPSELKVILDLHKLWLKGNEVHGSPESNPEVSLGKRANLLGANLRGANLRGADLRGADLRWADLRGADLQGANLDEPIARLDFGDWSICVGQDETSIGCKTFSNSDWLSFSPEDVSGFDPRARNWWEVHGEAVKAVIRCVESKSTSTV